MVRWTESYHYIQSTSRQTPLFLWTLVEECAYDYESIGRRAQPSSACVFFFFALWGRHCSIILACELSILGRAKFAEEHHWGGGSLRKGRLLMCWCLVRRVRSFCAVNFRTPLHCMHWGERLPIPARSITQNARSALHAFWATYVPLTLITIYIPYIVSRVVG